MWLDLRGTSMTKINPAAEQDQLCQITVPNNKSQVCQPMQGTYGYYACPDLLLSANMHQHHIITKLHPNCMLTGPGEKLDQRVSCKIGLVLGLSDAMR